jgi:hypothetical protein
MTGLMYSTVVEADSSCQSPIDPPPASRRAPTKNNPGIARANKLPGILRIEEVAERRFIEDIIVISL